MIKSEEVEKLFTDEEIRALLEGMSPYWDAEEAYRDFEDENLTQKELDFIGSAPQIIRQLSKENERLKETLKEIKRIAAIGSSLSIGCCIRDMANAELIENENERNSMKLEINNFPRYQHFIKP